MKWHDQSTLEKPKNGWSRITGRTSNLCAYADGVPTVAKVAKGFNNKALGDQLSIIIINDSIAYLEAHAILLKIVNDSFKQKLEYEIIQI